jgi:hypothetical protein
MGSNSFHPHVKKENMMNIYIVVRDYNACDYCEGVETKVMTAAETFAAASALIITLEKDRMKKSIEDWQIALNGELFEKVSQERIDIITGKNDYDYRIETLIVQ